MNNNKINKNKLIKKIINKEDKIWINLKFIKFYNNIIKKISNLNILILNFGIIKLNYNYY